MQINGIIMKTIIVSNTIATTLLGIQLLRLGLLKLLAQHPSSLQSSRQHLKLQL